jgi:antitoxin ParD1/3/4
MAAHANKPVSVTLGPLGARAEARVRSGGYASVSEVVRAGLRALDREEAMVDALLKAKIAEALDDPRADVPIEEAFERMDAFVADQKARRGR